MDLTKVELEGKYGWQVFVYSPSLKRYIPQGQPWKTKEEALKDADPKNWFSPEFLSKFNNPIRPLRDEKKWVMLADPSVYPYSFKVWNPRTRITLQVSTGSVSSSWHLFVFIKYKYPPVKGKERPTYSRFYDHREDALKEARRIMALPLSALFSILKHEEKVRIKQNLKKYLDWADKFFRETAFFAPTKQKYTYIREDVIIKLRLKVEENGHTMLIVRGENYPPLVHKIKRKIKAKIFLGYIGSGHDGFDKDYFLLGWPPFGSRERTEREEENKKLRKEGKDTIRITEGLDEVARSVFWTTRTLGWVEDITREHIGKQPRPPRADEISEEDEAHFKKYLEGPDKGGNV